MPNNKKARSLELSILAADIAAREHIDPANPPADNRQYISEIITRGNCHRETARRVWARWFRRARFTWGGSRPGAGRKK